MRTMAKLLQWLGAGFVLLLVGGSFAGFAVLKDRVRVIIQDDAAPAGPDPTALLRDDVQVLQRDLAALAPALGAGLEKLAGDLDSRAEARHQEVTSLRRELAAVQQRAEALAQQLAALQGAVAKVADTLATGPVVAGGNRAEAAPTTPVEPTPVVVQPVQPVEPTPVPVPEPVVPAPVAKTTGFLSFQLPSAAFHFDQPQDFVLVPSLCRVGFDAKSTLHDFSGVTSNVEGSFRTDLHDPAAGCSGEVKARAGTLLTGVDGRDANMRELLDTEHHPDIRFVIERLTAAADGIDQAKQTVRGDIAGKMTIHGQSRDLTMPVTLEVDAQKRLIIAGQAKLKVSDYGITPPSQLGVINMQDEVVVWVALRARVKAGGEK